MPLTSLVAFACFAQFPVKPLPAQTDKKQGQGRPGQRPVQVGWHDDLDSVRNWKHLVIDNKPTVSVPYSGTMRLTLSHVPAGWPYEYQWSGVTRRVQVDVGRYPFLAADVTELLGGYAHMDIDVLDSAGKAVKTIRSSTLQAGGISFVNLRDSLDPAIYTLQLRLIVGGSNDGCWATYDWVCFTSVEDGERLRASPSLYPTYPHPDFDRKIDFR